MMDLKSFNGFLIHFFYKMNFSFYSMEKSKNKKKRNKILIIVGICVVVVAVGLFFILKDNSKNKFDKNFPGGEMPGDFQGGPGGMHMQNLTDDEISEVEDFFNSSPDDSEIESYCQENMNYCMYYCMENSESDYCESLMPSMEDRTPPEGEFPK